MGRNTSAARGHPLWKAAYLLASDDPDPDVRLLQNLSRACFQHLVDRDSTHSPTTDSNDLTTSVKCAACVMYKAVRPTITMIRNKRIAVEAMHR